MRLSLIREDKHMTCSHETFLILIIVCGNYVPVVKIFNAALSLIRMEGPWWHQDTLIIVAKASDGQRYPLPLSWCLVVCEREWGSGPEGADDVCM